MEKVVDKKAETNGASEGIEKVETLELVTDKVTNKEELPTKEEIIILSDKQKEIVLGAIENRRFIQNKAQEAFKREGEVVALVIDGAGLDNSKVAEAKVSEDGTSLILRVLEE